MNTLIRTTLLALLCLIALAARAMPCPMPATSAASIATAAGSEAHCDDVAEAGAHAGMNLGDCLSAQPALPQTPVAALAPGVHIEPAPLSHAPAPVRLTGIEVAPPARPPPGQALTSRTSLLWSSTQRLLL